jgi:tryptophan-rich sensory protein|tara:strand:- start:42 stop:632 length:591 start_codon:yes stop_codon:yes gene_type:complete
MQKNSLLIFILGLMLINFVSAYYNSYSFSLGDFFDSIDSSTMILGSIFLISFVLINFSLSRVFKDQYGNSNKSVSGMIAFIGSLLITWGINRTGFDYEGLFYSVGFSSDFLYMILPLVLLGIAIYIVWSSENFKRGLAKLFLIYGGGLFLLSFTEIVYEGFTAGFIGIVSIIIGAVFLKKSQNSNQPNTLSKGSWS